MLHGIEVFNESFCPAALEWAIEKKLTIFSNTDEHGPSNYYDSHRPLTLVFSKSRTQGGIREALFNRRTVAYFGNTLVGESIYLNPLFFASLEFENVPLKLKNKENRLIFVKNNSDINYELELAQPGIGFDAPEKLFLKARQITPIELTGNSDEVALIKILKIYYEVKNLRISNDKNLVVTFSFQNI